MKNRKKLGGYDQSDDYGVHTDKYTWKDWAIIIAMGLAVLSIPVFIAFNASAQISPDANKVLVDRLGQKPADAVLKCIDLVEDEQRGCILKAAMVLIHERQANTKITTIYWSDGDSGRINGDLKFRLANIDAPETGSMKQRGGAKCEAERKLGYGAKEYIVGITKGVELTITNQYGLDRYKRLIVDLSAEGKDVGSTGVDAGHLRAWPHKNGKKLRDKPDWCE